MRRERFFVEFARVLVSIGRENLLRRFAVGEIETSSMLGRQIERQPL